MTSKTRQATSFVLGLLLCFFAFPVDQVAANQDQSYRAFPGGSIVISYQPEGTQCRDSLKGTVKIGDVQVPEASIRRWNSCRGYVELEVPESVSFGKITIVMNDGKTQVVGEFTRLSDPVVEKIVREMLKGGPTPITSFRITGKFFGEDFYNDSLFVGKNEVLSAWTWKAGTIEFDLPGTHDGEPVSFRRYARDINLFSAFFIEPRIDGQVMPTITTVSTFDIGTGSTLSIYGFGLRSATLAGSTPDELHVSIADVRIPDTMIKKWTDTRVDVLMPDNLNLSGAVKLEFTRKNPASIGSVSGPEVAVRTSFANDTFMKDQAALRQVRVDNAWQYAKGSPDVVVAVIDSGINTNNLDITDNIWTNKNELPGNNIDDDKNGYVDDMHGYDFVTDSPELTPHTEHGTAVASIIGASGNNSLGIAGVNWKVQLMSIAVFDDKGVATTERVDKAIRYAADNGAQVINLSMGGPGWTTDYQEALSAPIAYAYSKGAVIVAAAGNGDLINGIGRNLDVNPNSPACNDGDKNMVIGVGSVDSENAKSVFSDYGKCIDVMAPGEDVTALGAVGSVDDSVTYVSGTSFAAPLVSGVAALLKAAHPQMSNAQITETIKSTALSLARWNRALDGRLGAGLLDAQAALAKAAVDFPSAASVTPPGQNTLPTPSTTSIPGSGKTYVRDEQRKAAVSINADKLLATSADAAPCVSGTLIKGASSAAVYYCGANGKRFVFPNQQTYMSWYENFDGVVTLSDEQLAKVLIGGLVTYRPGTRMLKITSDPTVYAVAANGELRAIGSEAVAKRLYGSDWNKMIDDISDAFFVNYKVGAAIDE